MGDKARAQGLIFDGIKISFGVRRWQKNLDNKAIPDSLLIKLKKELMVVFTMNQVVHNLWEKNLKHKLGLVHNKKQNL